MAKKKTSKHKVTSPQEFSSSPFKHLKGLPTLLEKNPQSQSGANNPTAADVVKPTSSSGDHHSFAEEMDFLGVKPLPERAVEESRSIKETVERAPQTPIQSLEEREEAVFLDAIGGVEKIFKDEWPEDTLVKRAVPRRMKQVERGLMKPEAELDLHGLTANKATEKVRFFLRDAIYHGFRTVLIITGKGLHSNDGPVLRQAMEKILDQQREQVIEWGVAPKRYGGGGALVVFLRQVFAK